MDAERRLLPRRTMEGRPSRRELAVAGLLLLPALAACGNGDAVAIGAGTEPCKPTTCAAQGKDCGSISDACGGNLDCGMCAAPDTCGGGVPNVCGTAPGTRTYTTNFLLTEDPISEGGNWVNGQTAGLDWTNVRTTPGFAFGTQSGTASIPYDDSTALLTGAWGPDQTAQATVHVVNGDPTLFEEVELRLRSTLTPHSCTGYEVNFRVSKDGSAFTQIVRWNGALGDFTELNGQQGAQYGVKDGDVIKASILGSTITAYLNGVQVDQTSDTTFTTGNPGIGFFLQGAAGQIGNYGLSSYTVTAQ